MTILFMAGELDGLTPSDGSTLEANGFSGINFDPSYARGYIQTSNGSSFAFTPPLGSQTNLWTHFDLRYGGTGSVGLSLAMQWVNSTGTPVIRMRSPDAATLYFDYWTGSAYVLMPTILVDIQSKYQTIDVQIIAGSKILVYIGGTLRFDSVTNGGVVSMPAVNNVSVIQSGFSGGASLSQMIVTNLEPTIGWKLATRYLINSGSISQWTGGYTDVNELSLNDANYISTLTAGQTSLFTAQPLGITSFAVRAVAVDARFKVDLTGPQNLKLAIRTNGTTNYSANKAGAVGYAGAFNVWTQNPTTGLDWTVGDASSFEPGVQSAT